MSAHLLEQRLTEVRRHVRIALWAYGLSWVAAVGIGSVLAVCLSDWLIHFDDSGVRLILGLAIVGATAWVAHRFLLAPLRVRFTDTDLALRVEDRYPGFHDSLASSVQFLESQADPRLGSPALQRAVVRETLDRLEGLDFGDAVQTRPVQRMASIAVAVCLAGAVIAAANRPQTAVALQRLLFPFSGPAWPRSTNLRLLDADLAPLEVSDEKPLQLARGDSLRLYAENLSGRIPTKVTLEYRPATGDGKLLSEPMRPTTANGEGGQTRELAVGNLPNVRADLLFRAVGGDDNSMSWHKLVVIPPPVVETLQVTLTPPAYTKRPVESLPPGVGHVEGLLGTRVDVSATTNKPLQAASLRVKDQQRHTVELDAGATTLKTSFVISEPGLYSWWFDLKDQQGIENGEPPRYEVRGIQDSEPEVRIDEPASDLQITADAEITVRTVAKDDLGLREIRLVYQPDGGKPGSVVLFTGDERPLERSAEYLWKIAELAPEPGQRIVFHTEATDDYEGPDGSRHIGRSVSRTLTVVTKEEKSRELAQRQTGLLDDLERTFKLQKQAHDQVGELRIQLQNAGRLRNEDVDALQRTELSQREVASQLTSPVNGLEKRARQLLDELRDNHLDDPETERRLAEIADELERLGDEHLPVIEQELTQARKLAQSAGSRRDSSGQNRSTERPSGAKSSASQKAAGDDSQKPRPSDGEQSSDTESRAPDSTGGKKPARPADETSRSKTSRGKSATERSDEKPAAQGDRPSSEAPADEDAEKRADDADEKPTKAGEESESSRGDARQKSAERKSSSPREVTSKPAGRRPAASRRPSDRPDESLRQADENQSAVVESLSEMLQDLAQWRSEHNAVEEVRDLIRNQEDLNQKTGDMARQTLTRSRESLSPQEQADLSKLAERQKRQADQLDQLEEKMRDMVEDLSEQNPQAAAALKEARDQARQEALTGRMREAAGQIGENKMGEAARSQEEVLRKLKELDDILQNRRESDTENLVKKLQQAEQELQNLRDRQQDLARQMQQAGANPDPQKREQELERLKKEQDRLRDETARMARRLQRLQARKPGASTQRAAQRMQQAREALDEGEQAEAAQQQQEALDDLEQAQRELAQERREAQERLARELLEKAADELVAMISRQQAAIEETNRLEELHAASGKWSRAQLLSLRNLAEVERALKEDTDRLVERLSAAEVFALALKGASRNLGRAADLLAERVTGDETRKAEESALRRFEDLVASLARDQDEQGENADQENQQGGQGDQQAQDEEPPTDGIPTMAQLKMLISLQRDLAERTAELEAIRARRGSLGPAEQQELDLLAREQGELADLTRNLSRQAAPQGDDAGEAPAAKPEGQRPPPADPDALQPEGP